MSQPTRSTDARSAEGLSTRTLRRTVLLVAALNLAYFGVEAAVALAIGSVSLLADSVDFLEDTSVNVIIALALTWSLRNRARAGKAMALIILLPAVAALWEATDKLSDPVAPDARLMVITAAGAAGVNLVCALILTRVRAHGGSLGTAAFLAARNDVFINLGVIAVALVTAYWVRNGWPDIVLGLGIVLLNGFAAKEVWEVAEEEALAAKALAGEEIDA